MAVCLEEEEEFKMYFTSTREVVHHRRSDVTVIYCSLSSKTQQQ